jgi:tRNA-2-methylthio-N6-dimethylallyladenosine synthase
MAVFHQGEKRGNSLMKYKIFTFGCQMNEADSERIASVLEGQKYTPARKDAEADLIVVNMCSVRQPAVDRIFGLAEKLAKLKAKNRKLKTILTGCVLPKDRKKFAEKFDEIMKFKDLLGKTPKRQSMHKVSIPISEGCRNACTYCAVPFTRGGLVCRRPNAILTEIKQAIKAGAKEIWLLGQNVNDYTGKKLGENINFAKLLKMASSVPGDFAIRFMSPNPKNFSDELINVMASCKKIANFLNLPVQSGDDKILKAMNRPYTAKQYTTLVKKIREKIPGINLTTDVIVGFPGETKKQFQNTAKLFREIKFNLAYISKYSIRPGTAASKMKDNVPLEEKRRREKILRNIIADGR